jgi:hypothetical protein
MKQNKPFDPLDIGFFGTVGVMLNPDAISYSV